MKLYFEDFVPGERVLVGSRAISEKEIVDFALQFDPQPFHIDAVAAKATNFGGLIASGWHTCALMMRMLCDSYLLESASLGSPGMDEIRWLKPVRPGDVLSGYRRTVEVRPSNSKPDRGSVLADFEAVNQAGEQVMTMRGWGMFLRRPAA